MGKSIGQSVGYVRVSTADQNTARQTQQLQGLSLDRLFIDIASGKDANRPQLNAALMHLREHDVLYVHSMDRLARNLEDLRRIVTDLTSRGVTVKFIKEGLEFDKNANSVSKLLLSIMGAFAEFERNLIRERQREGIAIAKTKGAYKGRKPVLSPSQQVALCEQLKAGAKKSDLVRQLGISRQTLYNYVAQCGGAKSEVQ
jgi:DNA invertase Pin-like site-specific DNA recombinase